MKRYWVELQLKVRSYDEVKRKIGAPAITFEPASNLTPEPAEYIAEVLVEQAQRLAKAFIDGEGEQDGGGR